MSERVPSRGEGAGAGGRRRSSAAAAPAASCLETSPLRASSYLRFGRHCLSKATCLIRPNLLCCLSCQGSSYVATLFATFEENMC